MHEYLNSLRGFHYTTETNKQCIKKGEVVLVQYDTYRSNWKLAVIGSLIEGGDDLVPAANIRTRTGRTNRPITKLYPLEVTADVECQDGQSRNSTIGLTTNNSNGRPRRAEAYNALRKISEWARCIGASPESCRINWTWHFNLLLFLLCGHVINACPRIVTCQVTVRSDHHIDYSCVWISRFCLLSVPLSSSHRFPKLSDCCLKTCTTSFKLAVLTVLWWFTLEQRFEYHSVYFCGRLSLALQSFYRR